MSADRPTCKTMSMEEATVCNMWEIAAIVEVLERKGLWADPQPVPPWEWRRGRD
jgi:hypothetical protein